MDQVKQFKTYGEQVELLRQRGMRVNNPEHAQPCGLTEPQLESWLKSLNILRNYAAHHARMFNRVYDIKPKLNNDVRLAPIAEEMNRAFGQLSLIQYLHRQLDLSPADRLPKLFDTYPHNRIVPVSRTGAPNNWPELTLWRV